MKSTISTLLAMVLFFTYLTAYGAGTQVVPTPPTNILESENKLPKKIKTVVIRVKPKKVCSINDEGEERCEVRCPTPVSSILTGDTHYIFINEGSC